MDTKQIDEINIEDVKRMMPDEALPVLDIFIRMHPDDDEALTVRGMKHWAAGHRSLAVNDYLEALRINPESRARHALAAVNAILDYRNTDLLNP